MSRTLLGRVVRFHGDFLAGVAEAFGDRPWTASDLRRHGISLPAGRGLQYFHNSDAIERVSKDNRHVCTWKLSEKYLQQWKGAA